MALLLTSGRDAARTGGHLPPLDLRDGIGDLDRVPERQIQHGEPDSQGQQNRIQLAAEPIEATRQLSQRIAVRIPPLHGSLAPYAHRLRIYAIPFIT